MCICSIQSRLLIDLDFYEVEFELTTFTNFADRELQNTD